jgi:hypothetical protein
MSYGEAKELALLRQTLRDCFMALDPTQARVALSRLADLASTDAELRAEADRWAFRFGLLGAR